MRSEKNLTAEHAEIAELLLGKDKNHQSSYEYGLFFASGFPGDEEKRMNEEEAESAEEKNWKNGMLDYWNNEQEISSLSKLDARRCLSVIPLAKAGI